MSFDDDKAMRAGLRAPFPPEQIGKLPKPTKKENPKGKCKDCGGWHGLPAVHLDYIGHAAITDRLNEFAPGWFYVIDEIATSNGQVCIRATMTVGGVSRPEFGIDDDPQKAISNFIRRGAMRFGVGLDLWSKEDLHTSEAVTPAAASGADTRATSASASSAGGPVEQSLVMADATGGSEAEIGEGSAEDPPVAPSERDDLWMSLLQLTGSETRARGRLNSVMPRGAGYTAATVRNATADEIARAIEAVEGAA